MLLSALTTWFFMHWRMPLRLCPGSSPHRWLWEQGLLAQSWGQLRDLCQARCTPALGSLCPWLLLLHHCLPWMMWSPTCLLSQAMTLGPLLLLFPKASTNVASIGAAACECDDCVGLCTGERKPGSPWLELLCLGRNGAALWPLAPGVCNHTATLLPLFTPSSVQQSWSVPAPPARKHLPSAPCLLKEQPVRQAGTGVPQSLWNGETAD